MKINSSVSVIVPVFNNEKTIYDTLQSIADTLYGNLKIIVFDDGSTDSSIDRVYQFKNHNKSLELNIYFHPNNENKGVSFTRNQAMKHVASDYVSFLDADDIYFPSRFDAIISILDNDLTIDAAFGLFERYQEPKSDLLTPSLKSVYPNSNFLKNNFLDLPIGEPLSLTDFLSGGSGIHISTITFRANSFKKLGGFPNLKFSEDHAFFVRAISTQKVVKAIHKSVSIYRINNQSSCSTGRNTIDFNYSNVLAYIDAIRWLQRTSDYNEAIETLKIRTTRKLFYSYVKPLQTSKSYVLSDNLKIMNIFINVAFLNPKILLNVNFHKIIFRLIISTLLKF